MGKDEKETLEAGDTVVEDNFTWECDACHYLLPRSEGKAFIEWHRDGDRSGTFKICSDCVRVLKFFTSIMDISVIEQEPN